VARRLGDVSKEGGSRARADSPAIDRDAVGAIATLVATTVGAMAVRRLLGRVRQRRVVAKAVVRAAHAATTVRDATVRTGAADRVVAVRAVKAARAARAARAGVRARTCAVPYVAVALTRHAPQ